MFVSYFLFFFPLYLYEKRDISTTYCGNHFAINENQTILLYALNLYSDACHLFLNITGSLYDLTTILSARPSASNNYKSDLAFKIPHVSEIKQYVFLCQTYFPVPPIMHEASLFPTSIPAFITLCLFLCWPLAERKSN